MTKPEDFSEPTITLEAAEAETPEPGSIRVTLDIPPISDRLMKWIGIVVVVMGLEALAVLVALVVLAMML